MAMCELGVDEWLLCGCKICV